MWLRLRALVARLLLPRCPWCRALVERAGDCCSQACAREDAWAQANGG